MASKRELWNKAGRFFTGAVVLCFFLPFFGVSCNGMEIVKFSGADMVFGCKPGGMVAEMEAEPGMGEMKVENVDHEPLAIVAFGLGLAVFGLAWVRKRPAMIGAGVLSIAAVGALAGLYVEVKGDIDAEMKEGRKMGLGDPSGDIDAPAVQSASFDRDIDIDAGSRFGFWLTCLGFIGIAALVTLAVREPDLPPPPPPPPPPPG